MTESSMHVKLNNPLITLFGAFGISFIGIAIGAHWRPPASTALWMALSGALLVVLHDLLYALVWMNITSAFLRRRRLGGH